MENKEELNESHELYERVIDVFNEELKMHVKEALNLKGYKFNSDSELENFIKEYCSFNEIGLGRTIYYVENKEFLHHHFIIDYTGDDNFYTGFYNYV